MGREGWRRETCRVLGATVLNALVEALFVLPWGSQKVARAAIRDQRHAFPAAEANRSKKANPIAFTESD